MLKWIVNKYGKDCLDWICLIRDRDYWAAFKERIMKLYVPLNVVNFVAVCVATDV